MFYEPKNGHGLKHNPFNALITPRPIGWISTRGTNGQDNLAPYSFFNAVSYVPPQVMFASTSAKPDRADTKDSVANIRDTGVFCVNIVAYAARDAMNRTSGAWARDVDEFTDAGIDRDACTTIPCSRVKDAPAALECRLVQITQILGDANFVVFGEVVGIHIRDDILSDGQVDVTRFEPLARLGYRDYAKIDQVFSLDRPDD